VDDPVMTARHEDTVLCLNAGSSSLKVAVFAADDRALTPVVVAGVDGIGSDVGRAWIGERQRRSQRPGTFVDHASALSAALSLLGKAVASPLTLVGHRVVHGGRRYVGPARIDARALADLKELAPMAPLHMAAAIAGIEAMTAHHPDLPQVACFDTAFHASMPEVAYRLPLPDRFDREGVRRYGFHGLSYEYIMSTMGCAPPSRIIVAHLGSGSSLVAVKDGRAIDTTMGFTPTGGVLMGTRTGDLDPGALAYLLRVGKLRGDELESLVERESGLLAIGGSSDMRTLLGRAGTDPRARLAVSMFEYAVRKAVGALATALGGVDVLVFTGGIGAGAAEVRSEVCEGLEYLGIHLDQERNARGERVVTSHSSPCAVHVIPTDEALVIARHARRVVRGPSSGSRSILDA
jgi:acetate kinase